MTHQMRGQFGGEASAIPVAPQKFSRHAVRRNAQNAKVLLRVGFDVFKILPRSGYDQDAACQRRCVKAQGDGADYSRKIQVLRNL